MSMNELDIVKLNLLKNALGLVKNKALPINEVCAFLMRISQNSLTLNC